MEQNKDRAFRPKIFGVEKKIFTPTICHQHNYILDI